MSVALTRSYRGAAQWTDCLWVPELRTLGNHLRLRITCYEIHCRELSETSGQCEWRAHLATSWCKVHTSASVETVAGYRNALFWSLGVLQEDEGQLERAKEKYNTVYIYINDWENFRFIFLLSAVTQFRTLCGWVFIQGKITNCVWEKMECEVQLLSVSDSYKDFLSVLILYMIIKSLKYRLLVKFIGLWRWYINITVTILDTIQRQRGVPKWVGSTWRHRQNPNSETFEFEVKDRMMDYVQNCDSYNIRSSQTYR
jgi:hypothetical protein